MLSFQEVFGRLLCHPKQQTPTHRDEEWPPLAPTRESPRTETKTQHSQK